MPTSLAKAGRCPWLDSDLSFAGWVPTVLGHLAFSMVGVQHRWSQHKSFNDLDPTTGVRAVATHQRRTAQDFPIWDWLPRAMKPSASQNYFLVGQTTNAKIPFVDEKTKIRIVRDTQGVLTGTVYVVPWQTEQEAIWDKDNLVRDLKSLIDGGECSASDICSRVDERVEKALSENILVHKTRFALFRTGEIRIWSSHSDILGRKVTSTNFRSLENIIMQSLPKQIYYFIKDAAHHHYHHQPTSDQILPLVKMERVPRKNPNVIHTTNETRWRREILWGLARILARFRRENNVKYLKQALGILAYADSFQSTLGKIRRGVTIDSDPVFDDNLTTYDFAHAKQSIAASESFRSWHNSGNFQMLAGLLAIAFSAASLWASLTKIVGEACSANPSFSDHCIEPVSAKALVVAMWISTHPLVFASFLIIPLSVLYSIFVKDIKTFTITGKFSHFLGSLSQAIGASVTIRFKNAYFGYLSALVVLGALAVTSVYAILKIASAMHIAN